MIYGLNIKTLMASNRSRADKIRGSPSRAEFVGRVCGNPQKRRRRSRGAASSPQVARQRPE